MREEQLLLTKISILSLIIINPHELQEMKHYYTFITKHVMIGIIIVKGFNYNHHHYKDILYVM